MLETEAQVFCVLGLVDPGELLAKIEAQISEVSNEALSRKEIMDRIDWWLSACEEEIWLEDYNLVFFFS
ncbi:putative microtubule-associated protein, MAP65/Ase1/PRC1 [Helianthus annuus]|nr:putative microtubule-associated protein, MAP65/Ase1/PRC1 [Helianthus annuus]